MCPWLFRQEPESTTNQKQSTQSTETPWNYLMKPNENCATGRVGGVSHLQGGLGLKGYILYPKKINLGQSG